LKISIPRGFSAQGKVEIRVQWLKDGESVHVRTLSNKIAGTFTHHVKGKTRKDGRSHYCTLVDHGSCHLCRTYDRVWKGYTPVEVYVQDHDPPLWYPVLLELTGRAEAEMRASFKRGQVWLLSRPKADYDGQITAVSAEFLQDTVAEMMMPAFPIGGALNRHFHCEVKALDCPNPMSEPDFANASIATDAPAGTLATPLPGETHGAWLERCGLDPFHPSKEAEQFWSRWIARARSAAKQV